MLFARTCLALLAAGLLPGCGLVHFGRREKMPATGGDAALVAAYANLSTEHKILRQELLLARREGDALRLALERAGGGAPALESAARLAEAQRDLTELRSRLARLEAERASKPPEAPRATAAAPADPQPLREENARLRADLERARSENSALAEKLQKAETRHAEARLEIDSLNVDLLAQKQARSRAEQATEALRAQLDTVLARGSSSPALTLSAARESTATSTAILHYPSSPRTGSGAGPTPPAEPRPRTHVVQPGDTLEKIATRYYGSPERWQAIERANQAQLANGLRVGLELTLP
ncbi:MAG: LysM peptidoglycan-binding domain-containing protein [Verrucomicrobia bacterium]|nr:LysM peptidoglycan-binding domain-containing protein [Verrucomicrobiota bacterium]